MDSAIDKIIELAKEKGSKKKTVTVVGTVTLAIMGAEPMYIAGLCALFILLQSILDYFKGEKDVEEKNNIDSNS